MPTVEVSQLIEGSPDEVFRVLQRMEEFPRYMKNLESVTLRERSDSYSITEWVARLRGSRFRWVERDEFFPEAGRIAFTQLEGDLKVFQGAWVLVPDGGRTLVTLSTEFEFGIPMLATLLNPVAKIALRDNARDMVQAIGAALANDRS